MCDKPLLCQNTSSAVFNTVLFYQKRSIRFSRPFYRFHFSLHVSPFTCLPPFHYKYSRFPELLTLYVGWKVWSEVRWKGPLRFIPSRIFGKTSGGDLL